MRASLRAGRSRESAEAEPAAGGARRCTLVPRPAPSVERSGRRPDLGDRACIAAARRDAVSELAAARLAHAAARLAAAFVGGLADGLAAGELTAALFGVREDAAALGARLALRALAADAPAAARLTLRTHTAEPPQAARLAAQAANRAASVAAPRAARAAEATGYRAAHPVAPPRLRAGIGPAAAQRHEEARPRAAGDPEQQGGAPARTLSAEARVEVD